MQNARETCIVKIELNFESLMKSHGCSAYSIQDTFSDGVRKSVLRNMFMVGTGF